MIKLEPENEEFRKLARWEWDGLLSDFNLASGHARNDPSPQQQEVLLNLSSIYQESLMRSQLDFQEEFENLYFNLCGQKSYKNLPPIHYLSTSSISLHVLGLYCRLNNLSVGMLNPTFDVTPQIFRCYNLELHEIHQNSFFDDIEDKNPQALFLVLPNNPTGFELTKDEFIKLANYCVSKKKLLIIDFAFRFFGSYSSWDQYEILLETGVSFITLEDTGKNWPLNDLKFGPLTCSKDIYSKVQNVVDDFILNVSPFIINLTSNFIRCDSNDGKLHTATCVAENRKMLRGLLSEIPQFSYDKTSTMPTEWIEVPSNIDNVMFSKWIAKNGVHILPGYNFYWHDHQDSHKHIRIALSRTPTSFQKGASEFVQLTKEYLSK